MYGYKNPKYCLSFTEIGDPIRLQESGGWIIRRRIPDLNCFDAMGPYPFFYCEDWDRLELDIKRLKEEKEMVSFYIVPEPFGDYDSNKLKKIFKDTFIQYKKYYVMKLDDPIDKIISKHHKKYIRKSLAKIEIERVNNPLEYLDDWIVLYNNLKMKHNISNFTSFSKNSFKKQLSIPGTTVFRAFFNNDTIGMLICFEMENVVHFHLSASNELGYKYYASYGIHYYACNYYESQGKKQLFFGGGAGISTSDGGGLNFFKKGWSNKLINGYFCGVIIDKNSYNKIMKIKNIKKTKYFPAYREGEFD